MPNYVFPYPGSKARHADWIVEHTPKHTTYVELFGGSAGLLFNKPESKFEVYNDLNSDIPHFFKTLRDRGNELKEWLKNVPYSRAIHEQWVEEYYQDQRKDDPIERAGRFFYLRNSSHGAKIEGKSGFSTSANRHLATAFKNNVDDLDRFRERLRNVTIESMNAFEVLQLYDSQRTFFYADPPYYGSEARYNSEEFDHSQLAELSAKIEGKIAISYDSVPPMYGERYHIISKESSYQISKHKSKDNTQYLIMNYNPKQEPMMASAQQSTLGDAE